jgi:hypothetical protein
VNPKRLRKRPMALRMSTQYELIARFLLMGWTARAIARHLHVKEERVRYAVATPEFETLTKKLLAEHLQVLDRKIEHLLYAAVRALQKQLRHRDWRARASAIEQILKIHGRAPGSVSIMGQVNHTSQVSHQHVLVVGEREMSDEERRLVYQLLALRKPKPKQLPPGPTNPVLTNRNGDGHEDQETPVP